MTAIHAWRECRDTMIHALMKQTLHTEARKSGERIKKTEGKTL